MGHHFRVASRARHSMKRLTARRRNIPRTHTAFGVRTRQASSPALASNRCCSPFSMPQYVLRLTRHDEADNWASDRLVSSQTVSFLRPLVCGSTRAACAAKGKQTRAEVTGQVAIARNSLRPLLISFVHDTRVVIGRGGKTRRPGGSHLLHALF